MKLTAKLQSLAVVAALFTALGASAAAANAPTIKMPFPGRSVIMGSLSDNGKWALSEQASTQDGDTRPEGGTLINMETMETISIKHSSNLVGVGDVTDDGMMVVGECAGLPAYWLRETNKWVTLPLPAGVEIGRVNKCTPDGRIGVGYGNPKDNIFGAVALAWDLTTNQLIDLPGLPVLDMQHEDQHQNFFTDVSADGRYLSGNLSYSYLMPVGLCSYVYDLETGSYNFIGFTEHLDRDWEPKVPNLHFVEPGRMSCDGHYITGDAYLVKPVAGSEWPQEYRVAYLYNVWDDEFEIYDGNGENDYKGWQVLNDGMVLAATPAQNPYAYMKVRHNGYFYDFEQILSQAYGISLKKTLGFDNSGRPFAISADGRTIIMFPTTTDTYIVQLKEDLADACEKVDLLGNYTVDPVSGTTQSSIGTIKVKFDREIAKNCTDAGVRLCNEDGSLIRNSLKVAVDGMQMTVTFRTTALEEGKKYKVEIPEGAVTIKGDANKKCKAISLTYNGRDKDKAVSVKSISPANGSNLAKLDYSTNYVKVTFDTEVKLAADGVQAYAYRVGENSPFATLNSLDNGTAAVAFYPTGTLYLYNGTDYRIVIPAGTVTDLSGNGANEEISVTYSGTYERILTQDDRYLFNDNCSNYDNFLLYEGDHNTPVSTVSDWGFHADSTPWWFVRDSSEDSDTNMALASHSMYTNSGKSDDWLTTPQLMVPDEYCYLTFDAQSYKFNKNDHLKVIIYEDNNVYNTLTADIVDKMRTGDLVFDQQLSPGVLGDNPALGYSTTVEERLAGDWVNYVVKLDAYKGKNIYICFLNDNEDQSAVFVDNIQVVHDLKYLVNFEHSERVIRADNVVVKGAVTIASDIDTFNNVDLTLLDGNDNVVDRITESGLALKKNDNYRFEFAPMPLELGAETPYTVKVTLDGESQTIKSTLRNLTFEPSKRITLEEYTGADCPNCPQGVRAIENIEKLYPGKLIPLALHTYSGDVLGTGVGNYSAFLGLEALGAPSARINRRPGEYPMLVVDGDYRFSGRGIFSNGFEQTVWLDLFQDEIQVPCEADIYFDNTYDPASGKINVSGTVRSAINLDRQNIGIFAVLTEDDLETYQSNGFGSITDPDFGEWGAGGSLSSSIIYPYYANEVVRGWFGETYNGTFGLIPASLQADGEYPFQFSFSMPATVTNPAKTHLTVMMINGNTDRVINANICALNASTGVETIAAPGDAIASAVVIDGKVIVNSAAPATVQVYNLAGSAIAVATGNGNGLITADLNGYTGLVIVKISTAAGSKVEKLVVK